MSSSPSLRSRRMRWPAYAHASPQHPEYLALFASHKRRPAAPHAGASSALLSAKPSQPSHQHLSSSSHGRCLHASGLLPPPQISAADQAYDEKNIRRRVYDALNVLMAMEIITKEKKSILWRGLPTNTEQEGARLQMDLASRGERMERKKQHLQDLVLQQVSFKELISRNRTPTYSASPAECRIALPFIVVNTRKETVIDCEMAADRQEIFFNFSAPFEIHDDSETLKRMNMHHREPDRVASLVPEGLAPFAMEVLAGSADMMGHGTINGNGKRK